MSTVIIGLKKEMSRLRSNIHNELDFNGEKIRELPDYLLQEYNMTDNEILNICIALNKICLESLIGNGSTRCRINPSDW